MKTSAAACGILVTALCLVLHSAPSVAASLCQTIGASTNYPQSVLPNREVPVVTTVAGSCTSDGEDYFAVRVDLVDRASNAVLSSNSTPIGYDANNFTVNVRNNVLSPTANESWPINVDTYLVEAGATSGKYLLNSTTITIQVGADPLPEFEPGPILIIALSVIVLFVRLVGQPRREFVPIR
jgi:hypothetical protein